MINKEFLWIVVAFLLTFTPGMCDLYSDSLVCKVLNDSPYLRIETSDDLASSPVFPSTINSRIPTFTGTATVYSPSPSIEDFGRIS